MQTTPLTMPTSSKQLQDNTVCEVADLVLELEPDSIDCCQFDHSNHLLALSCYSLKEDGVIFLFCLKQRLNDKNHKYMA